MPASAGGTESAIDVIVVNYRTAALTEAAVREVSGPLARVLVTDNSGDLPPTLSTVAEVWVPRENTYFARGNNYWYERTSNPWVLLLNPDTQLSYSSLLALRDLLAEHPEFWGIAPRLVGGDGVDQNYLRRFPTAVPLAAEIFPPMRLLATRGRSHYLYEDVDLRTSQVIEQPPAACLLLRRSAVGPTLFNEELRLFFNDAYLAWRLNQGGRCWYEATITAVHHQRASIRQADPTDILAEYATGMSNFARLTQLRGRRLVSMVAALRLAQVSMRRYRRRPSR